MNHNGGTICFPILRRSRIAARVLVNHALRRLRGARPVAALLTLLLAATSARSSSRRRATTVQRRVRRLRVPLELPQRLHVHRNAQARARRQRERAPFPERDKLVVAREAPAQGACRELGGEKLDEGAPERGGQVRGGRDPWKREGGIEESKE